MSKYYSSSIAFGAKQTKTERVVVSPTKIGDVTTDAVSGALTVDEVPTLDSLNPVSSDGVARAVIQAGAELPTRGSSDTGKVLTVANSDGDLEWDEPAEELPDMEGQSGKLLGAVDNNGTMEAQWVNPPDSYPSVTGNAGKVLKVNAGATGVEWATDNTVTVDQTYNSSSTNAQSGTAVAGALLTVNQVPASTTSDENKVLTVNAQGAPEWADTQLPVEKSLVAGSNITITEGTNDVTIAATDTTYTFSTGLTESSGTVTVSNPLPPSTSADEDKVLTVNAQGAAEWATAQSGPTYTAGVGIDITAGVVSADIDGVTIKQQSTTTSTSINGAGSGTYASNGGYVVDPGQDIVPKLYLLVTEGGSATVHIPGNTFYFTNNMSDRQVVLSFTSTYHGTSEQRNLSGCATALSTTYDQSTNRTWVDEQDVVLEGPADDNPTGNWIHGSGVYSGVFGIGISYRDNEYVSTQWAYASDYGTTGHLLQYVETSTTNKLAVAIPIPAFDTTTDLGKVLQVTANGLAWVSLT